MTLIEFKAYCIANHALAPLWQTLEEAAFQAYDSGLAIAAQTRSNIQSGAKQTQEYNQFRTAFARAKQTLLAACEEKHRMLDLSIQEVASLTTDAEFR